MSSFPYAPVEGDPSGRHARRGFEYQDLCGLRFCIDMILGQYWDEVWCESLEDLVLVRGQEEPKRFRYVQVKHRSENFNWTHASLTKQEERKGGGEAKSTLVKLFEADKGLGQSDFRLVINGFVSRDLSDIAYRWKQIEPEVDIDSKCATNLLGRLGTWQSHHQRSVHDYVQNFAIEQHPLTVEELLNTVYYELSCALSAEKSYVLADELEEILWLLYREIHKASNAHPRAQGNPERIPKPVFLERLHRYSQRTHSRRDIASSLRPSLALAEFLGPALLPGAFIQNAEMLRLKFRQLQRAEQGTSLGESIESAMDEIRAVYTRQAVTCLETSATPRQFLLSLLDEIERVYREGAWQAKEITLPTMHGMFYFMIARGTMPLCWDEE